MAFLVNEITRHRDLYYKVQPEISDAEYDKLEDELRTLDPSNPILQEIGRDASELFTKREHIIPMGSQDKVVNPQEFLKWAKKRNFPSYLIQFKLDGISIELQYDEGKFDFAVTRGDGLIGDDVSVNVIKMKGFIPKLAVKFTGAVRAEVMLFHDIYNQKYTDKQNCRNAAAGLVRRKDGVGSEDLNLVFYDAISISNAVIFEHEVQKLKWLKEMGFNTILTKTVKTAQEVVDKWEKVMTNTRQELNYDIDGLVIKGKQIDMEDMRRAKPMKQIAFKFEAEEEKTVLREVEWSISGHNYTPVAIVDTVEIAGTNVSRASLANPDLITMLKIKIGSEVMVSKRGDIIPKIERVVFTPPDAKEIEIPTICETCHTKLTNEGTRLYCPNEECPKRDYHRLVKWIHKLDVKDFSEKLMISKLFKTGKLRTIADYYILKVSDLTKFEGVQEKSAKKALDNLLAKDVIPLETFIAGFNIENMGERLVKKVVDAGYNTLDKIKNATVHDLRRVDGFADISAAILYEGIRKFYPEMKKVLDTGKISIKKPITEAKLRGKSFCFTGALKTLKRAEAERLVTEHGGEVKNSVVKGLSYLVTNSTERTVKFVKAEEQGTKIISEEKFLEMIGQ
ncbi:MAG: NAD-dependent DNA ligase LigA [Candidatus Thorarchaeota archaeon]